MKLSCSASEQISVIFLNSCLTLYKTWNIFRRQNHGTWKVGVDLEDHLVTTPAMGLSLDQVAQDFIQPGLEHRNMLVWPSQGYWKSPRAVVISLEEQGQAEEGLRTDRLSGKEEGVITNRVRWKAPEARSRQRCWVQAPHQSLHRWFCPVINQWHTVTELHP